MDGSNAAFLFESPLFSTQESRPVGGILYIEDFDDKPAASHTEPVPASVVPSYSAEDLAQAREAGRQEGLAAAFAEAQLVQSQLQSAATQSLADGIAATRSVVAELVQGAAEQVSLTLLAILRAALPAVMGRHNEAELRAMISALAPGIAAEPELRVRAHPDLAEFIRETLISVLETTSCVLSVCADSSLQPGDVLVAWQDGQMRRNCRETWSAITEALAPLGLQTFEEIYDGR